MNRDRQPRDHLRLPQALATGPSHGPFPEFPKRAHDVRSGLFLSIRFLFRSMGYRQPIDACAYDSGSVR
ncbi:hypothetical protein K239x_56900 [Planctomycetes bacterium K23_9]|uniref:Uncharacterized protein n=1 Tax=Stieleria marina TaxID=1930275 RepID=A0A517P2S0_9BACT|nr:hypothetical protein K239x_56900 [Planctomycetes bacterium K23_9]